MNSCRKIAIHLDTEVEINFRTKKNRLKTSLLQDERKTYYLKLTTNH